MFFQRHFERKDISVNNNTTTPINGYSEDNESVVYELTSPENNKDNNNNNSDTAICLNNNNKMGTMQLTPLWEHILRTRRLPETICPSSMFAEFHERLQDPEWQVRQHALRVLVDVLVVMQAKADKHSMHFLIDLIYNLGHQSPTIRKGALDCLRVYLSETAMPEMVMLQILDTGLGQHATFVERLSCGVLLSLPALLQSILHTPQRRFVIKDTMKRLLQRLQREKTHQEITLKVMVKIEELVGSQEFQSYLNEIGDNDNEGIRFYKHLCKVFGISKKPCRNQGNLASGNAGAWRALPREHTWRSNSQAPEVASLPEKAGKVIMETEIKINDDTLTMRILEADTETEETDSPIIDRSELVCRPLASAQSRRDLVSGILQIISDSEVDDMPDAGSQPSTPSRGLKRVTFGGEVVKMRTPDSDAASTANNNENASSMQDQSKNLSLQREATLLENFSSANDVQMTALSLDIPSDNTKPLTRARSAQSPQQREQSIPVINTTNSHSNASPKREIPHQSPVYRSRSISPAGSSSVSPRVPHKQIEVLHNLQRDVDPSPRSFRRSDSNATDAVTPSPTAAASMVSAESAATPNTWEDLDIVDYKIVCDLRSANWRNRLQGFVHLDTALSSSSNLVLVQPYLSSLLRTLLSSERNCEVAKFRREMLINLISRLPLENLEERTIQILSGLCRQENAGANRVCKALMQRLPAGTIVAKLTALEYLHAKSSKFRDHALQMCISALMSFPGTCFDINILTAQVTYAALHRKRRVREAALEVLAVLADISTVEQVLQIVDEVSAGAEQGPDLVAAVKMRLSRNRLPIITSDGSVVYIFHNDIKTGNLSFGADVDWIEQGEGSASPNEIKRRRMRIASRNCNMQQSTNEEEASGISHSYHTDENLHRHSFHSPPEALDMSRTSSDCFQKKNYGTSVIQANYMERRLAGKACSESSMDGRSTDSTTTTCSSGSGSGSGSFIQLTSCNVGTNRGLVRQNSRFPVVRQHTDFISNFMRNMQRTPYPYSFEGSKFSKVQHKTQRQQILKKPQQSSMDNGDLKVNETKKMDMETVSRDVVNFSKSKLKGDADSDLATMQSNDRIGDGSPLSAKSTSYSQKSTASAKTYNTHSEMAAQAALHEFERHEMDTLSLEHQFGELVVDDIEEEHELSTSPSQEPILKRNGSINSLHSKTESIKTQLEDNTPQMSRAQSIKSLAIEEEIDSSNSFVVVEEELHELESPLVELKQQQIETTIDNESPSTSAAASRASASSSKKSAILRNDLVDLRSISMDSLYAGRSCSTTKQGSLDLNVSTTDNSSHNSSQSESFTKLNVPLKVQHTLKQKSKTSYLLRNQRRVSPVKQSITVPQNEIFPNTMTKFDKPREALTRTFDQLESPSWETNVTGLKSMVRLIRYHGDFLDSHLHLTCIQLNRNVRNLRSQVARAACHAASELFTLKCKSLETECDDLVCSLLHRTADTNRFIRADAGQALESMVDNVQPSKVLNIITSKGAIHQNGVVRTTAAKMLGRLVDRLGNERIYNMNADSRNKIFTVGANLLLEGSLETRSFAKSMFRALSEHATYNRVLLEAIPTKTYRNVEKSLRNITR